MNSRHLTDRQLVEILYDDLLQDTPEDCQEHLDSCQQCTRRLGELRQVSVQLDRSSIHVKPLEWRPLTRSADLRPADSRPTWRIRTAQLAIAAAVLLAASLVGFVAGSVYQGRALALQLDKLVAREMSTWQSTLASETQQREAALRQLIDQRLAALATGNATERSKRDAVLRDLAMEQGQLRQDLEVLAINAESQIRLTHQELEETRLLLSQLHELASPTF